MSLDSQVQTAGAKFEPFITRYPTDSADPLKAATQAPVIFNTRPRRAEEARLVGGGMPATIRERLHAE